jgi:hypothetical protein
VATLALFWFPFAYNIFSHPFTFSQCVCPWSWTDLLLFIRQQINVATVVLIVCLLTSMLELQMIYTAPL